MSKEIRQMIDKVKSFNQFINESSNSDIKTFLVGKSFLNPKSKNFFYHGTKISPDKFVLRDDYNGEDSSGWGGELPKGYLFLTTSLEEAKAYGQYIIPCELKKLTINGLNLMLIILHKFLIRIMVLTYLHQMNIIIFGKSLKKVENQF